MCVVLLLLHLTLCQGKKNTGINLRGKKWKVFIFKKNVRNASSSHFVDKSRQKFGKCEEKIETV